ncbi:MAG: DUF6055 domain-containing protein [Clostridiales bacterium]|nr:DUF6055 domain-containing protein [Clostridiales bacterium]
MRNTVFVFFLCIGLSCISVGCKKKAEAPPEFGIEAEKEKPPPRPREKSELEARVVFTSPRDGGTVWNLRQPLVARFSRQMNPGDFSFTVTPDPGGWEVSWEERGKSVFLTHAQPFRPGASYTWNIEIRSPNQSKLAQAVSFTAFGPSSLDLIEEGERSGKLDLDKAWTYRFCALMTPHKLPAEYRSPTPIPSGTSVIIGYRQIENKLKHETRQEIKPYLMRPSDPGSIYREWIQASWPSPISSFGLLYAGTASLQENKRPEDERSMPKWYAAKAKELPVKVLSPTSMKAAQTALNWIKNHAMYEKFKNLLGVEPLSDAGEKYADGTPNEGGDGDLDIYLVPADPYLNSPGGAALGMCVGFRGGQKTPCYILIQERLSGKTLAATLAHELFHAFQLAIDAEESTWWMESTAVWAEDFVGPDWNVEQDYLPEAFDIEKSLLKPLTSEDGLHEYGIYLFPYYLSTKFGNDVIGRIWKACETQEVLDAVEASFGLGGLGEGWKEFSRLTMDIEPEKGVFLDTNGPLEIYCHHFDKRVWLEPDQKEIPVDFSLEPLSAIYIRVVNLLDPQKTPHVRFDLGPMASNADLTIQSVIDPGEKDKKEDWTSLVERTFCLNREEERFSAIELVVASKSRSDTHSSLFSVVADAEGCAEAPSGTITYKHNSNWEDTSRNEAGSVTYTGSLVEDATIRVNLKYRNSYLDKDYYVAELASGVYSFRYENDVLINGQKAPPLSEKCEDSGKIAGPVHILLVVDRKNKTYTLDCGFASEDKGCWKIAVTTLPDLLKGPAERSMIRGFYTSTGEPHFPKTNFLLGSGKMPGTSWTWNLVLPPRQKNQPEDE